MPNSPNPEDYELLLPSEQTGEADNPKPSMGREEQLLKPENREGDALANLVALGASGVTLLVTWVVMLSNEPTKLGWFLLHPTLQTLAMTLFTYGILTLQPTSQPKTKTAGLSRHQIAIFCLGFPSIFVGTFAIVYNKSLRDAAHFTTWHGTLGIIAMAWIVAQVLLGGGSVWFNGAAFGGGVKAKSIWKYHRLSGYILFPLLLLTVDLGGAWSHWGENNVPLVIRLVAYLLAPAATLGAIYTRVRVSKMKFF